MGFDLVKSRPVVLGEGGGMLVADPRPDAIDGLVIPVQAVIPA